MKRPLRTTLPVVIRRVMLLIRDRQGKGPTECPPTRSRSIRSIPASLRPQYRPLGLARLAFLSSGRGRISRREPHAQFLAKNPNGQFPCSSTPTLSRRIKRHSWYCPLNSARTKDRIDRATPAMDVLEPPASSPISRRFFCLSLITRRTRITAHALEDCMEKLPRARCL